MFSISRIPCLLSAFALSSFAVAETITIEPDNYSDGTVLTSINSLVALSTTGQDNVPIPLFEVTATRDAFDYAPTGAQVFGHANIQFFNDIRRLRMDFAQDVRSVSLAAAGGDFFNDEIALLRAYNIDGELLEEVTSIPLAEGQPVTISITRPAADIAFAISFTPEGQGNFLRLDHLQFETSAARPGDIDNDGDVDVQDLAFLLATFGLCDGQTGYAASADLDGDNCVTLQDLAILLAVFGT